MMMNGVASSGSGVGGAGNMFQMTLIKFLQNSTSWKTDYFHWKLIFPGAGDVKFPPNVGRGLSSADIEVDKLYEPKQNKKIVRY